jgi:hypothetical protein
VGGKRSRVCPAQTDKGGAEDSSPSSVVLGLRASELSREEGEDLLDAFVTAAPSFHNYLLSIYCVKALDEVCPEKVSQLSCHYSRLGFICRTIGDTHLSFVSI